MEEIRIGNMEEDKERAEQCAKEIEEVLKKYNCSLNVIFKQEMVVGNTALIYNVAVEPNKAP